MPLLTKNMSGDPVLPSSAPDQSRADRRRSFDPDDFPMPTGREEEWRFTPMNRLESLLRDTPSGAQLACATDLPGGVTLKQITAEQARALGVIAPSDRPAALAVTRGNGAMHVDIPAEAVLEEPVRVHLVGTHSERVWSHLVVTVGHHAKATVVLQHEGSARCAEVVSVVTADGADLTLVSTQEWADGSLHLAEHDVVVGREATVRHIVVTLGGDTVRVCSNVEYAGPGGSFDGLGLYFVDAGQHMEHRLFVDHAAPQCTSNVEYKGALQGQDAHAVWVGDVLIRAAAEATETYELNRNLVLTDGARADSVPNLEIETGEIVGAGHASATGRFDDEQLFYLQARGIPQDEALRLVVRGYFAEILGRIPVPELQAHLTQAVEHELARTVYAAPTEPR